MEAIRKLPVTYSKNRIFNKSVTKCDLSILNIGSYCYIGAIRKRGPTSLIYKNDKVNIHSVALWLVKKNLQINVTEIAKILKYKIICI